MQQEYDDYDLYGECTEENYRAVIDLLKAQSVANKKLLKKIEDLTFDLSVQRNYSTALYAMLQQHKVIS